MMETIENSPPKEPPAKTPPQYYFKGVESVAFAIEPKDGIPFDVGEALKEIEFTRNYNIEIDQEVVHYLDSHKTSKGFEVCKANSIYVIDIEPIEDAEDDCKWILYSCTESESGGPEPNKKLSQRRIVVKNPGVDGNQRNVTHIKFKNCLSKPAKITINRIVYHWTDDKPCWEGK